MTEEYASHLARLHAQHAIPAELLDDILREVSPARVTSTERIVAGEVNEVYGAAFADGLRVVVRISRDDRKNPARFGQERWAIQECAARGVPVPEVLGVWSRSAAGQPVDICVQRRLDGVPLADSDLPPETLRAIVAQAGELLSRIHAVPVRGFGYIDSTGAGEFPTAERGLEGFLAMEAEFHALGRRVGIADAEMRRALQAVADDERAALSAAPCLTHNDFSAKHILVADGAVSGIVDFGEAAGAEPIADLVRWDYYDSARLPLAWLLEGYASRQALGPDFPRRLHVKRIAFSLWVLRWYDAGGYAEGVADARAKLARDLAALGHIG